MEEFKNCNPKQIVSDRIIIPIWKVVYSYSTNRGNYKEATKYLLLHLSEWDLVERCFETYIVNFNETHPERNLSNVKILDMDYFGEVFLDLE